MFTTTITILLAAARLIAAQSTGSGPVTGILGNASVVENNPPGVFYTAILPTKEFFNPDDPRGNIKGTVVATANDNGIGVSFQVQFENLPTSGGPFRTFLGIPMFQRPRSNRLQYIIFMRSP